jgi:hypothetical protein
MQLILVILSDASRKLHLGHFVALEGWMDGWHVLWKCNNGESRAEWSTFMTRLEGKEVVNFYLTRSLRYKSIINQWICSWEPCRHIRHKSDSFTTVDGLCLTLGENKKGTEHAWCIFNTEKKSTARGRKNRKRESTSRATLSIIFNSFFGYWCDK